MSMMYMARSLKFRSKHGPAIDFKANKPVYVPPMAIDEVIAIGGVFADEKEQKVLVDEPPEPVVPAHGFERKQKLYDACANIANRNAPDDFTPNSKPKLKAVQDIVGFDVDRKEINDIWTEVMRSRSNAD